MYTFRDLQKARKINVQGKEQKIVVLGNTATQFLAQAIEGYAKLSEVNLSVLDIDYNQIDAQLLDPSSETYAYKPDNVFLWLATEKLYEEFLDLMIGARESFAEDMMQKIRGYWNLIEKNTKAKILQPNFTEIDDKVIGQYSEKVESTFIYQIKKLNYLLQTAAVHEPNVFLVDLLSTQINMGYDQFFDAKLYYSSKMSLSMKALPEVAKAVVDIIRASMGKVKKCVILDLDNTLWGGVIGDDGLAGIEVGELGKGHVFTNLQRWIKQLKEYGIILAVCSKNNEDIAKEPFEKHEEMVLHLSDISIFVANWDDKASNIKLIQESLNIGFDSMIFLDDNPFERNLVKERFPDIEVPDLPEDPSLWLNFLRRQNYFETTSYTGPSSDRTKLYQAEFERRQSKKSFESIDDYLKSLEMVGAAKPFDSLHYPRIAELTQRSNQFNLRTVRYTEADIQRISEDRRYITLYFMLKDKFGDHGLVSVVIMEKTSDASVFIDTWLMSCRVLKRGMEEFVVNKIVDCARENGISAITAEYLPTPKNKMVKDIYKTMGFTEASEGKYYLAVCKYKEQKNYISEE